MNLYFAAYPCSGALLRRQIFDKVLLMVDFNVLDGDWVTFPALNAESPADTTSSLISNRFTELFTEPTHQDGNVLDLILSNFNDPGIPFVEKHLTANIPASEILTFKHWTSKFPCRASPLICYISQIVNFIDDCRKSFQTIVNTPLNCKKKRKWESCRVIWVHIASIFLIAYKQK